MTATSTTFLQAGLLSREGHAPVALERVVVTAHATGLAATVTLTQHFCNTETVPLEVVYVFPLDEGAAVRAFEAVVDGVRYVGEVKEREAAFRDYDDAMEAGHGAFLLDEERPDVFTASLGNLKPRSRVVLTLTYVTELGTEGLAARFTLPTTVSPRYAPAEDHVGIGRTDADALNPPVALDVPYRFTFEMRVDATGTIAHRLAVTSHQRRTGRRARHGQIGTEGRGDGPRPRDRDRRRGPVGATDDRRAQSTRAGGDADLRAPAPQDHVAGRGGVPDRPLWIDAGHVDRRGAQRAPTVLAIADRGLPLQHCQLRLGVRIVVRGEPPL